MLYPNTGRFISNLIFPNILRHEPRLRRIFPNRTRACRLKVHAFNRFSRRTHYIKNVKPDLQSHSARLKLDIFVGTVLFILRYFCFYTRPSNNLRARIHVVSFYTNN